MNGLETGNTVLNLCENIVFNKLLSQYLPVSFTYQTKGVRFNKAFEKAEIDEVHAALKDIIQHLN